MASPSDDDRTRIKSAILDIGAPTSIPTKTVALEGQSRTVTVEAGNALPPGTHIGEFEIEGLVAEGGFGIVYRAHDHSLGRRIALKEYMPSMLAARSGALTVGVKSERHAETFMIGLKSFINEAHLLAQFDHPSLVKVYRFWEANGTAYLVMPLYEGLTLKETLVQRGGRPDEAWLKTLLSNLVEALRIIHAEDCFHRDIAPDNILMLKSGTPVLLDFGAARRVIGGRTQALTVIVKAGYAPIEQYAEVESMQQGPWTDIYALAGVAYFAITGAAPVPSVVRIVKDPQRPLAETAKDQYSAPFLQAIDRALSVKPEDRPQSVDEFARELGLGAIRRANSADQPSPAQSPQRSGWLAPALLGLGAIMIAGTAALFYFKKPPPVAPIIEAPAKALFEPVKAIEAVYEGRDRDHVVTVSMERPQIRIGQDLLSFTIRSAREGYVYVVGIGTERTHLFLLFPNELDREHRVQANGEITLPRKHWQMMPSGPPGTNHFVAIVSDVPRSFAAAGAIKQGDFLEIPLDVAKQRYDAYAGTLPILAGAPECGDRRPCAEGYGAIAFSVAEIPASPEAAQPTQR
ncbi:MAG: protein kinase domain-containing protein [Burkholderiales bacterium]